MPASPLLLSPRKLFASNKPDALHNSTSRFWIQEKVVGIRTDMRLWARERAVRRVSLANSGGKLEHASCELSRSSDSRWPAVVGDSHF